MKNSEMEGISEQITTQLWDLAEGHCSPKVAKALRQRIAEEPAVAQAWKEIQMLQNVLQKESLEQPSLRFRQAVLDRLPAVRQQTELLPKWALWAIAASFFLLALYTAILPAGTERPRLGGKIAPHFELYREYLQNCCSNLLPNFSANLAINGNLFVYGALATIVISLLLALDRLAAQRWSS